MDKRKKRTSINQYLMYIELLEKDTIFRTGTAPREAEPNYINNKWRDLAGRLNTCPNGPQLSPEEWKKRLNDWKNSTRCKYRRSISGEKDISMSPLEVKALSLFGKTPVLLRSAQTLEFKSDTKALYEAEKKHQEAAKAKNDKKMQSTRSMDEEIEGIFIDDDEYNEDESVEEIDVKNTEIQLVESIINSTPKSKRRRTVDVAAIETKPVAARQVIATTVHTSAASADSSNNISAVEDQQPQVESESNNPQNNISIDTGGIEHQLKRIADIKAAKLQFEIAKYKYNNPGFEYTFDPL